MRILFVHPNHLPNGAEMAGSWPPAWVAYLTGLFRRAVVRALGKECVVERIANFDMPNRAKINTSSGGTEQMEDA